MDTLSNSAFSENCALLSSLTLPRWEELPDLDLYMDQVLALMERYLGNYPGFDGKGLTASMVNNYVKLGIMPAPVKKKYTRTHLAYIVMICLLKPALPIASIQRMLEEELKAASAEEVYDRFCGAFERTNQLAANIARQAAGPENSDHTALLHTALLAQAEQAMALKLYAACFPPED